MTELLCCFAILLPFFVGSAVYMINSDTTSRNDGLGHMAGLLTLKPLLTTPIWLLADASPFGLIPAVIITLVIARKYQHLLLGSQARMAAQILIGLDCARWMNSLFISLSSFASSPIYGYSRSANVQNIIVLALFGIALPFIYVIVALVCVAVSKPPQVDNGAGDGKPKTEPAEIYARDEPEQVEMIFEDEPEKPKREDDREGLT